VHFVHLVLTHPDLPQPGSADAERVLDILWARLDPRWGIQHIRTRPCPGALDLGLFFGGDGAYALPRTADVVDGLLATLPGWVATAPR
jgi:hypothetical protein